VKKRQRKLNSENLATIHTDFHGSILLCFDP
jgi:hypothetical protein